MKGPVLHIGILFLVLVVCDKARSQSENQASPTEPYTANNASSVTERSIPTPQATARIPPGVDTDAALPPALSKLPNVLCRKQRQANHLQCTLGKLDIGFYPYGCEQDGFYGKIRPKSGTSATLWDRFPSPTAEPIAKLKESQLVCITGDARPFTGGERLWVYVTAIPVHTVKACMGKDFCDKPGDLPIEWMHAPSGQPCRRDASDRYVGDCPSGWIKVSEVGEFSMGL